LCRRVGRILVANIAGRHKSRIVKMKFSFMRPLRPLNQRPVAVAQ